MTDKTLACCECGREFVFTVAEQTFFQERGFEHEPKRCLECRKRRRRKSGGRGHGTREDGPPGETDTTEKTVAVRRVRAATPPRGPRQERPPAQMHDTTCSVCDEATQVPFQPDGVRPVYCLPCLKKTTR